MPEQPSACAGFSRRRRRLLIIIATILVVLVAFAFLGLPPIVRAQAVKRLSAKLDRPVAIERLRLNPLTFSATIDGLAITDHDGRNLVGWRRLYVDFDFWRLVTGEIGLGEVFLDGFAGRVVLQRDGTFNFSDLIPPSPPPSGDDAPPAEDKKNAWPLRIGKLAVTDARLDFTDETRSRPFATTVGPVSFVLENFRTVATEAHAPYAFRAVTESGEHFSWNGTVNSQPASSAGEFRLGGIALKKYAPYYAPYFRGDILGGTLDIAARYAFNLGETTRLLTVSDGSLHITGLQIAPAGDNTPVIDLPVLDVEGIDADALKPAATIRRISSTHGHIHLQREANGSLNLLGLLPAADDDDEDEKAAAAAAPATPPPASRASAFPALPDVKIAEFAINDLAVVVDDLATPTPARNIVEGIGFTLKNISLSEPATPVALTLEAQFPPGGRLRIDGPVTPATASATLAIDVQALPLAGITPYLEPFLNLRIAGGNVGVKGEARYGNGEAGFKGDLAVNRFGTVDGVLAEDFVKFSSLGITGIDVITTLPEPRVTARVDAIRLVDPSARFAVNADGTTNFSNILRSGEAPASSAAPAASGAAEEAPTPESAATTGPATSPAVDWSIGKIELVNGSFAFADRSQKPAVHAGLDAFSGTVTGLSSDNPARADLQLSGKIGGTGILEIAGKLDPRALTHEPGAATEIKIGLRSVDLTPASPYAGRYAGYELARANLALDIGTRLESRKVRSDNVITLNQFTFGNPTNHPDATKLPVRLAVALLKDTSGNIVIDVPVQGDLDDPEFRIGRVVWRVILNLVTKAATSPFSLIGSMFGGGGEELAWQEFEPGAADPLESEIKKIETLRKALQARPALNLDITGSFDAEADTEALRRLRLAREIRAARWEELRARDADTPPPEQITVAPEDEARIVSALFAARFPDGLPSPSASPAAEGKTGAGPANADIAATSGGASPPASVAAPSSAGVIRKERQSDPYLTNRGQFARDPWAPVVAGKADSSVSGRSGPSGSASLPRRAAAATATPGGKEMAAGELTPEQMRAALTSTIEVTDDDLRELATRRAEHVRAALLEGEAVGADRLFVVTSATEGQGSRVLLQLR
ncbi:uncharacterized protein involved in outer membrane biogenesis [Opitutaceae bacterium TAV1]|nr:uncharacterized protein involved in outer membrane biogenesis [Opitutaceae bacterium TAV1]